MGKKYANRVETMGNRSVNRKEIPSYKRGGKVKATGLAKLHKGERVLTVKQTKKYAKKK